jgi:hypothetical protein
MVVHKDKHWRQLCLAAFFNAHRSDYFWNLDLGFYGDKDTFRVAWMATRTPYALPTRHVGLVGYTSGLASGVTNSNGHIDANGHANAASFNGHAMLHHHHVTGAPVFLHRNQRKWDPRVLNPFPPAGRVATPLPGVRLVTRTVLAAVINRCVLLPSTLLGLSLPGLPGGCQIDITWTMLAVIN